MTVQNLERLNDKLLKEATEILNRNGLLKILRKYGEPVPTGSYALKLMTWRDLDIYLETKDMTKKKFFDLGGEISEKFKPHKMSFRNEFISRTRHLPEGLYWGVYTAFPFPDEWKIDIWAVDSRQVNRYQKGLRNLQSKIDQNKRGVILSIKHHFCKHVQYRKEFFSYDIYRAVISDNVRSVKGFAKWLKKNQNKK